MIKTQIDGQTIAAEPPASRLFRDAWIINEDLIEVDVEKAKPIAVQQINTWRDAQKELPFTVDGIGTFSADGDSKANIDGAAQAALMAKLGGQPFTINWSLHDDSEITLDADKMQAVGLGLMAHVNAAHTVARGYKNQVRLATDLSQIEAILNNLS
jgi:hypothetical protein